VGAGVCIGLSKIGGATAARRFTDRSCWKNLGEQRAERVATGHPDPHLANGNANQGADFEEPQRMVPT